MEDKYLSIHKVSTILGVTPQTLRLWDSNGYLVPEQRRDNGYRYYSKQQIVLIDRWYPSSKTCSCCGNIYKELKLSDRVYICPKCSVKLDRDINAAINIRNYGQNIYEKSIIQA